ncbi:MAG: phosphate ABC transporter permease PstA [Anaerolineae bacterium]
MSSQNTPLYSEEAFKQQLNRRHQRGRIGQAIFFLSNILALIFLISLFAHIINQAFGYVIYEDRVRPADVADRPLEELTEGELVDILVERQPGRVSVVLRDRLSQVEPAEFTTAPLSEILAGSDYPEEWADLTIGDLEVEQRVQILSDNLSQGDMLAVIIDQVIQPTIVKSWSLIPSLVERDAIEAEYQESYPEDRLEFKAWVSWDFVTRSVSSSATTAGLRTALLGSFWIISITAVTSLVLGVGAAIYLEEYARDNWINRTIEINIRNLAAIPSIIYGMLGLAVFVRALGYFTSGQFIGITDTNGRTALSAGLTLALLILPIIIVTAQEALRAVPSSIREASYGIGATRLQTVFRQVVPTALPGIMTGVILAMSRAVGETAPLLVVGASTFIGIDPSGPFSKFTVVPIQIYQWTSRPEAEFKNVAAGAIIVLLVVMLLLNGTAIILRNRFSRSQL